MRYGKKFVTLQAEMKTRAEYIDMIRNHAADLKSQFGVRSLRIFGSVAREQQTNESDVDVCIDMPPRIFKLVGVRNYLEELLGCRVDVVREHNNMNALLRQEIDNDGIFVFN